MELIEGMIGCENQDGIEGSYKSFHTVFTEAVSIPIRQNCIRTHKKKETGSHNLMRI